MYCTTDGAFFILNQTTHADTYTHDFWVVDSWFGFFVDSFGYAHYNELDSYGFKHNMANMALAFE